METKQRVVIVGGGFGGLYAARELARTPVAVTLVDRRNFHLFQPLLYQVATGALSPANIASPLRAVLKRQTNARVLLGEVTDVDLDRRTVRLSDGELGYDFLVIAAGARNHYFGHPEWEHAAPGLKSLEDATHMRARILKAFEEAERAADPDVRQALLTFVVVGGGPTGVELAGALAEMSRHTLRGNFRTFDSASARILLLEGTAQVLGQFPAPLPAKARRALERMGVEVRSNVFVTDVCRNSVNVREGDRSEQIACHTVLWAAGVRPSPLAEALAKSSGAALEKDGRVRVGPELTLPGRPEVFAIGDMASCLGANGQPLPGLAPVAMQQGTFVAREIVRRLHGKSPQKFQYFDRGMMATIGRARAVAAVGPLRFNGWLAWAGWLCIHILFLIAFENRVLVLFQWTWNYITLNRSARLITGVKDEAAVSNAQNRLSGVKPTISGSPPR
jgi:NADH dehydrogenase